MAYIMTHGIADTKVYMDIGKSKQRGRKMPFNKETAAEAGRKGGMTKKAPGAVRNKPISIIITPTALKMIDDKAAAENVSRTELIIRAVKKYK